MGASREGDATQAIPDADRPWLRHYPVGMPADLDLRYPTMLDAWQATVARLPGSPAIHYFEATLTFGQIDDASDALAVALDEGGLDRGDRVAVFMQNDPQWLVIALAAWKLGAIPVALNPMYKHRELRYHLDDSGATVLVCLESLYRDVAQEVVGDTPVIRVITTHPGDLFVTAPTRSRLAARHAGPKSVPEGTDDLVQLLDRYAGRRPSPVRLTGDDVAILTYTSGTTGAAKGAMNLHRGVSYNSQVFGEWFDLGPDDPILGVAPLFHITGIVGHLGVCIVTGAPLVLFHRFDTAGLLRVTRRWRPTFTVAAITVYLALLDHPDLDRRDLMSLTKVASGGAPVSPAIVERFRDATGITIHSVYGLTETTSPSHLTPLGSHPPIDPTSGALSVGLPVPGADVTIVDGETGRELAPGEVGEIVIAGPMVVPGYWGRPEESAAAIPDGRLHTGDVGSRDGDGWFFVVDRIKDQINAGGYKIWPREVEDVLYTHPAVREAAVIGVPDPYRGETVKAFVSLGAGHESTTSDELITFCRDRMAAYKYPRVVQILADLPKTPTGKFLRRELRDRDVR